MRVKLKVVTLNADVVFVSQKIAAQLSDSVLACFGCLSAKAQVKIKEPIFEVDRNSEAGFIAETHPEPIINIYENNQDNLEEIIISSKLKEYLLIQEHLTYQIKLFYSRIVIGPVIGLLLRDDSRNNNADFIKSNNKRFSSYKNIGGLFCVFSPININFKDITAIGYYYNFDSSKWEPGEFPIPEVIYRRYFPISNKIISRLKKLTNKKIFNSYRFNKFELYKYLIEDPILSKQIPITEVCSSIPQIIDFTKKHKKIILKPIDLSRGRGICFIHSIGSHFRVLDYRKKKVHASELPNLKALSLFLKRNKTFLSKYIMQNHIPLARIDGNPYDVRVVMHKTPAGIWENLGIECRVSRGSLITNISRGGYALKLEDALAKSFSKAEYNEIKNKIDDLCSRICTFIEKRTGEHYAEFGMDIGIDAKKNLWIIEVNVRPSYDGFKDIDLDLYNLIRSNPLLYAVSLTEFKDSVIKGGTVDMSKTVKIKALDSTDSLIVFNADKAKDLAILDKRPSYITFGAAKCYAQVRTSNRLNYDEMQISHDIMEHLKAPEYLSYEIRHDGACITLGPSIGILAGKSKKSITQKQLKSSLAYVSHYQLLHGAVILFSLDCVNKNNHTISGYCYNPKYNRWEAEELPYPSAIYRRLALSEKWRNHFLEVIGDNLYYNYFFNKWMMYQWFSNNKEMSQYFPETILYKSGKDIQAMLNKYGRIYVKPIAGQGGKGVIQIVQEDEKIIYRYSREEKKQKFCFDNMTSAIAYGAKLFKKEKHILQQPIELIKYQGNILDIRCMMLRDDKNKWECSGIVGRIAANGSIVSNSHSGGAPVKFDVLLKDYLGYSQDKLDETKENLKNISTKAAEALDEYVIKAAVLGIDVGIDTSGRLWIIEINIRYPGLDLFTNTGDYKMVDKTKTSLMLYGKYLAGFGPRG